MQLGLSTRLFPPAQLQGLRCGAEEPGSEGTCTTQTHFLLIVLEEETGTQGYVTVMFHSPVPVVVEESGPVEYCEEDAEEEGLDDEEMDELAYEEDPLLNSDYEDDGKYKSQRVMIL